MEKLQVTVALFVANEETEALVTSDGSSVVAELLWVLSLSTLLGGCPLVSLLALLGGRPLPQFGGWILSEACGFEGYVSTLDVAPDILHWLLSGGWDLRRRPLPRLGCLSVDEPDEIFLRGRPFPRLVELHGVSTFQELYGPWFRLFIIHRWLWNGFILLKKSWDLLGALLHQLEEWDESHQHCHTTAIAVDRMVQGGWQRNQTPIKVDHLEFWLCLEQHKIDKKQTICHPSIL